MISAGCSRRINRKSRLLLFRGTCSPALILWALTIMSLCAAWRKIFVSFTTGNFPDSIISRSTFPGPTLGSWFTSPTRIRRVPTVTAFKSACIRLISTMDISSMMITSASRGFSSFRSKCIPSSRLSPADSAPESPAGIPVSSKSRWMVFDSLPVASDIRFAARPVGAARRISISSCSKYRMIVLIVVVFPVPGPPVMIKRPWLTAS